ncbi:MAG: bifunctional demethylmenaquinone methyltransferase/2-methoxy-6-polyprenyl-1,4-benzoquinol methylase UbiE [Bacteroidota bacterium]
MKNYPPVGEVKGKKEQVEAMFDAIAPRYDMLNRALSMGIDRGWRKKAIARLRAEQPKRILDVATGTADLAIAAAGLEPDKVVGVDISEQMLEVGREKVRGRGLSEVVTLQRGDSEKLPFSDNQFDAALVAFGVRNFENLDRGLEQINRVLRPGSKLVVLEFSRPSVFPIKQLFGFYFKHVLPRIGGAVSKDKGAYQYLPDSVQTFPDGDAFLDRMHAAGFTNTEAERLTFGIASIYEGRAGG